MCSTLPLAGLSLGSPAARIAAAASVGALHGGSVSRPNRSGGLVGYSAQAVLVDYVGSESISRRSGELSAL